MQIAAEADWLLLEEDGLPTAEDRQGLNTLATSHEDGVTTDILVNEDGSCIFRHHHWQANSVVTAGELWFMYRYLTER